MLSVTVPFPPAPPVTIPTRSPGAEPAPGPVAARPGPHLRRSCFSLARFCELGVYWSKSHSAASEAGEEIKIWAVLASSQTSGCTHRCQGLRLRSSLAWPPAPTCATERGGEGDTGAASLGHPTAAPGASHCSSPVGHSSRERGRSELHPVGFSSHPNQTALRGAVGSPLWHFTALSSPAELLSSCPHIRGTLSSFMPWVTPGLSPAVTGVPGFSPTVQGSPASGFPKQPLGAPALPEFSDSEGRMGWDRLPIPTPGSFPHPRMAQHGAAHPCHQ